MKNILKNFKRFIKNGVNLDFTSDNSEVDLNLLNPKFSDNLEKSFIKDYFESSINLMRISLLLGILYYSIFFFLDLSFPSKLTQLLVIRFVFVCPFVFLIFLLSFTKQFHKWWQQAAVAATVVSGIGIVVMTVIGPVTAHQTYHGGILLVLIYGYLLIRLRFIWASLAGWLIQFSYIISIVFFSNVEGKIIKDYFYILTSVNILGMFGAYTLEYYSRKEFFFRYLLQKERKKVKEANVLLESRVKEKTKTLAQDIQKRKIIEEELRKSEAKLRYIFENTNNLYYSHKSDGTFTYLSPQIKDLGYETTEAPDKFSDLIAGSPANNKALANKTAAILTGKRQPAYQLEFIHKNNKKTVFLIRESPVEKEGEVIEIVGVAINIDEQIKAEQEKNKLQEQLIQAQKMESIGRLAGGVAHDFNNMLSVILGHADLIIMNLDKQSKFYNSIKEIRKATVHSAELTKQLLAFARKQPVILEVIDLNKTIDKMFKMLRRLIGENIELTWQPGPELWPVKMDKGQIQQILTNLCVNAKDATGKNGKIVIKTENKTILHLKTTEISVLSPGEYIKLSVQDNGSGMEKETISKIFEPFFTTKKQGQGTGLGLATVYGIIKQNRGAIDLESEVGKGTVFSIYLPKSQAQVENKLIKREKISNSDNQAATILVVEDETAILNLVEKVLSRRGYNVLVTNSPLEAIDLIKNYDSEINLLITDIIMPELDGFELSQKITDLQPGIKVIYMSGYTDDLIANHGIIRENIEFIQKPFTAEDIISKTSQVLQNH
ncbi:MAG: ATP-binding protein [Myxococcota bacterium]